MSREHVEVAVQRLDIHRVVHYRLCAVNQHFRPGLMGLIDNLRNRVFSTQNVRDLGDRHEPRFIVQQGVKLLKL